MRHSKSPFLRTRVGNILLLSVAALILAVLFAMGKLPGLAFLTGGNSPKPEPTVVAPDPEPSPEAPNEEPEPEPEPTPEEPPAPAVFTIGAVGDVLPHDTPIRVAHQGGNNYDFTPMLEATRAWSEGVDLAICNFEVPLSFPDQRPTGYPLFGAPHQLPSNLADLGWDGCSTGTNHTIDRGARNAEYTLDMFDEVGLGHAGSARSAAEEAAAQMYVLEREGQSIKVAQLGATFGTNGLPIPADKPWVVSLLNADRIIKRAADARDAGADLVIATLHWGNEYQLAAAKSQKDLAAKLAASGLIDMIIGTHPHVPQEFAKLPGGPRDEGMWVAYSLGNFISNQDSNCCKVETASGLFMTATVEKPHDGPVKVTGMEWTPMTVDRIGNNYAYPLLEVLENRPATLTLPEDVLRDRLARIERIMANSHGAEFSMRETPPAPTGPPPTVLPRVPATEG